MNKMELIYELINSVEQLSHRDHEALDAVLRRTRMITSRIFGDTSRYFKDLDNIRFRPGRFPADEEYHDRSWKEGIKHLSNLLNTMVEEFRLFGEPVEKTKSNEKHKNLDTDNSIFVVHGHNEEMKQAVARTLEKLNLNPVILHEQANQGSTVIEKFTNYSNVSFAIVLLSPDDVGYCKSDPSENVKYRARQNVIFELGYFIGKLGRNHVIALHKPDNNFEMPSDYSGILFTPFDKFGRWQFDLVKELKACGYNVDANNLM